MACRVRIQPTAETELQAIVAYLMAFGPGTAAAFLDAWEAMLVSLRDGAIEHRLSRFMPLARLGYHSVLAKGYIALYFEEDENVVSAHVFHQSQDYANLVVRGV